MSKEFPETETAFFICFWGWWVFFLFLFGFLLFVCLLFAWVFGFFVCLGVFFCFGGFFFSFCYLWGFCVCFFYGWLVGFGFLYKQTSVCLKRFPQIFSSMTSFLLNTVADKQECGKNP